MCREGICRDTHAVMCCGNVRGSSLESSPSTILVLGLNSSSRLMTSALPPEPSVCFFRPQPPLPKEQCSPVVIHKSAVLCTWWQEGLLWGPRALYLLLRQVRSYCKALADRRPRAVVLLQPSECWNCRPTPPWPVVVVCTKGLCNISSSSACSGRALQLLSPHSSTGDHVFLDGFGATSWAEAKSA